MRRKITSVLTLLISFLMAAPMFADTQSLTGIGGVLTTPEAGKYYVIQGNAQHDEIISWLCDNDGTFGAEAAALPPMGPDGIKFV